MSRGWRRMWRMRVRFACNKQHVWIRGIYCYDFHFQQALYSRRDLRLADDVVMSATKDLGPANAKRSSTRTRNPVPRLFTAKNDRRCKCLSCHISPSVGGFSAWCERQSKQRRQYGQITHFISAYFRRSRVNATTPAEVKRSTAELYGRRACSVQEARKPARIHWRLDRVDLRARGRIRANWNKVPQVLVFPSSTERHEQANYIRKAVPLSLYNGD